MDPTLTGQHKNQFFLQILFAVEPDEAHLSDERRAAPG